MSLTDYNTAIKFYPANGGAYYNRGLLKVYFKDYQGAILDYDKAIKYSKKNRAFIYTNRGIANKEINNFEGACLDWKKAIELGDAKSEELIKNYCK